MVGGRRAVRLGGRRAEPHGSGLERWWFVAFCDVLVVESAFGFDTSLTVLFASVLAARRAFVADGDRGDIELCHDVVDRLVGQLGQVPLGEVVRASTPAADIRSAFSGVSSCTARISAYSRAMLTTASASARP